MADFINIIQARVSDPFPYSDIPKNTSNFGATSTYASIEDSVVTIYVNTNSTAGGDGTTNNTSGATRAYASLLEAITNHSSKNLVSVGKSLKIICSGTNYDTIASQTDFSGYTTSSTNSILITTDSNVSNSRHVGLWSDSIYRLRVNYNYFNINNNNVVVDGLQILVGSVDDNGHKGIQLSASADNITVSSCIIKFNRSAQTSYGNVSVGIYGNVDATGNRYYYNNIIYDFINNGNTSGAGIETVNHTSGKTYVYNNTVADSYYGIKDGYSDIVAKNNIVQGCTFDYSGSFDGASANNISLDATSPNVSFRSKTVIFVNAGAEDYHLSASDTEAKDTGADLSAEFFVKDIDGVARTGTWDIGADEYVSGGATDVTVNASAINIPIAIESITVSTTINTTVNVSAISIPFTLESPTVLAVKNISIATSTIDIPTTILAPTVSTTSNVTVSQSSISVPFTLLSPTVLAVQNVTTAPSSTNIPIDVYTATVSNATNVTVNASATDCPINVEVYTVTANRSVSINTSTINIPVTILAPSYTISDTVSVSAIDVPITIHGVSVTAVRVVNASIADQNIPLQVYTPIVSTVRAVDVAIPATSIPITIFAVTVSASINVSVSANSIAIPFDIQVPVITASRNISVDTTASNVDIVAISPTIITVSVVHVNINVSSLGSPITCPTVGTFVVTSKDRQNATVLLERGSFYRRRVINQSIDVYPIQFTRRTNNIEYIYNSTNRL